MSIVTSLLCSVCTLSSLPKNEDRKVCNFNYDDGDGAR